MAICWRYFLSSYVFCVIGDHFWRIEDMLCHHHLHYQAVHHPALLSSTKRYEKRDPFTPPGYHPNHIDAQLLSQSLCYHFQVFESFLERSVFLYFRDVPNRVRDFSKPSRFWYFFQVQSLLLIFIRYCKSTKEGR